MAPQINTSELLAYGEQQIGKPYVFGAAGPNTFDCSGLITYMYKHFGMDLPHHSQDQAKLGVGVNPNSITAGDLVFSDWGDGPNSHVGIATGPNQILVAPETGQDVKVENLNATYRQHITAVRRVGNLTGAAPAPFTGGSSSGSSPGSSTTEDASFPIPIPGTGLSLPGGLGWWEDAWKAAGGAVAGGVAKAASPFTIVAAPLNEVASFFDTVLMLFKPSNFIRLVSGVSGGILVILGIWFLSKEIR